MADWGDWALAGLEGEYNIMKVIAYFGGSLFGYYMYFLGAKWEADRRDRIGFWLREHV